MICERCKRDSDNIKAVKDFTVYCLPMWANGGGPMKLCMDCCASLQEWINGPV